MSLKDQTSDVITIVGWLIVLVLFWIGLIGYCYFESKDEKNAVTARVAGRLVSMLPINIY